MTRAKVPSILLVAVTVCVLPLEGVAARATSKAPYDGIVTFGTSLSDSGNAFVLLGDQNGPPSYHVDEWLVPFSPYTRGGHHLTNGATWIEQFAQSIGLARSANPSLRGNGVYATNYAVGGARSYQDGVNFNLPLQVAAYLNDHGGRASGASLYVFEMGSNDVRDALLAYPGNPALADQILQTAVTSIAQSIAILHAAGARHFLVWKVPDLSVTPAVRAAEAHVPGTAFLANWLTQQFNARLAEAVAQLELVLAVEIPELDVFSLIQQVAASPSAFGLRDVTNPCITPDVAPFVCQQPDDYFFWDGIHPTHAAHAIIAGAALQALGLD
jgi:phospholipase/lecithinase/hemolysin